MSQAADLYTLLRFYASRIRSPEVAVAQFIPFLEKYAKRYAAERPDLAPWAQDTGRQIWAELPKLEAAGRLQLLTDESGTRIAIPQFYVDVIQQAYRAADEGAELPFPDESSLKILVPTTLVKSLNLELDLPAFATGAKEEGPSIVKLIFPEGSGSTLILSDMIPKRLLELALLKIRHYLRSHNNKEYVQHKLAPAFQGKESQLKDALNQLMVRPFDTVNDMEKAGDFSFPFWAYFASLVKGDIKKKNDRLPEDTAALQAVLVVEVLNNFYKGKVTREKEAETAFRNLDLQLEKPPFHYSVDDIVRFTDTKGIPLLGQYTREALENHLKQRSTTAANDQLPELLIVHGLGGERWFVKKSKMLPLCMRLLGDVRPKVKSTISQRWYKLMSDFRSEAAMEDDEAFDKELWELAEGFSPILVPLLEDKKLYLVHEELDGTEGGLPEAGRLFYKGTLSPMGELLLLKRKDILTDVRMILPFWYSIPVLSQIIAFFKGMGKTKRKKKRAAVVRSGVKEGAEAAETPSAEAPRKDRRKELKQAAVTARERIVPQGYSAEAYLSELHDRWNRIINAQAKENLTEDVNSLIRDYLRRTIRTLRSAPFTAERIAELAATLAETPNLQKLPARDSLRLYIQLYISQLLIKS